MHSSLISYSPKPITERTVYSGSLESRYRFLGNTVRAIFTFWPSLRAGVHIAPNGKFNNIWGNCKCGSGALALALE